MHQKNLIIPVVLVSLACLMSDAQSLEPVDPANSARVRVFQQADTTLYPGEFCYGSDSPAAIHAATSGFTIFSTTKRVGMPVTQDIKGTYNEYVIQAGIPMTVMLQWETEQNGVKTSCGPSGSTFFPQPGKDYDITTDHAGNCFIQIRELYYTSPGKAETGLVAVVPSFACARK